MMPPRSTLRMGALYRARGMISAEEYRDFRRRYLEALLGGAALPELPAEWHELPPGAHSDSETEEMPATDEQARVPQPRRLLILVLAVVATCAGALAWYLAAS